MGGPEGFVAPVTPGRIIIEVEGVSYDIAKEAFMRPFWARRNLVFLGCNIVVLLGRV